MDKKKLGPASTRVTDSRTSQKSNLDGKRSNEMIYQSQEFKDKLNEISDHFHQAMGASPKTDRQNGPDSPLTTYMKSMMKNKNIFRKK